MITESFTTTKKSSGVNTKEYIVLHHTASSAPARNVAQYLASGNSQTSCHYVVGENGEIYKIGNCSDILWHAGTSTWEGKNDLNKYSIGIEVNSLGEVFTDKQKESVRCLVNDLMNKYGIPSKNVIRHKDIAPGRKTDIGDSFWSNEYSTFAEYQESYNISPMTIHDTIMLLKDYWNEAKPEKKPQIESIANRLREMQKAAGEPVTK